MKKVSIHYEINQRKNLTNLILSNGGRSALRSIRCWERLKKNIVSYEEYLTSNDKYRKFELMLKTLKVKPFNFTPFAFL